MWYGLVFFPEVNHKELREFRKKYDPTYPMVAREHMTLLYPVPGLIGFKNLDTHIERILSGRKSFNVHFRGLFKSWDHWLLLGVKEGHDEAVKLHDEIYSGILRPYLRKDIPYRPYIGLGLFAEDNYDPLNPEKTEIRQEAYDKAYREAETLNFDFRANVDTLTLVEGNDMGSRISGIKEFQLL